MGSADFTYILAKSTTPEQSYLADGLAFYFEQYRGFGTIPHRHDEIQIIVPLGGRMHFHAEGEDHLMGPEWACLILPGTQHGFNCIDGEQSFLAIFAPMDWLNRLKIGLSSEELPTQGVVVAKDARLWLQGQLIAAELRSAHAGQGRVLSGSLELLGIFFLRSLVSAVPSKPAIPEPRVLRAIDTILKRYSEDLTVEALAHELAMSPRHFERCFKQAIGSSPRQFLIEVRIGAGREMLKASDQSVVNIAMEVGFKNPSHFSETFQRLTGMTPSAFRRQHDPSRPVTSALEKSC